MQAPDVPHREVGASRAQRWQAAVTRRMTRFTLGWALQAGLPVARQRSRFTRIAHLSPAPRDVAYRPGVTHGGVPGESVSPPRATRSGRTVLYLHGGGYCVGSSATYRVITGNIARRCAAEVFAADYRLAPEHPFPAAVDDAVAAYRGLLDNGVAPGALVIAGDSAGGGLAIATSVRLRELGLPQPAALVLFSPWPDVSMAGLGPVPSGDVVSRTFIDDCAAHYLAGHAADEPLASPVGADLRGLPATLIQAGGDELLLPQIRRLHAALLKAGVAAELEEYPHRWHVFQQTAGFLADAGRALDAAAVFVGSNTDAPAGTPSMIGVPSAVGGSRP